MNLAELVECSPTYISFVECGTKCMSLSMLIRIANALHVSADDILQDYLENTVQVSNHDFAEIVADCNDYEIKVLLDVVRATKASLRTPPTSFSHNNCR